MRRLLNVVSLVLAIAAVGLIATGILRATPRSAPKLDSDDLVVDATTKSFGVASVKDCPTVAFTVTNRGDQPIQILGIRRECFRGACIEPGNMPLEIPPHASREVVVAIHPTSPADFSAETVLFTDRAIQPRGILKIEGRIVGDSLASTR